MIIPILFRRYVLYFLEDTIKMRDIVKSYGVAYLRYLLSRVLQ